MVFFIAVITVLASGSGSGRCSAMKFFIFFVEDQVWNLQYYSLNFLDNFILRGNRIYIFVRCYNLDPVINKGKC